MAVYRTNCPHCPAEHVAFEIKWAQAWQGHAGYWNCIALCGACRKPICFIAAGGTSPDQIGGDITGLLYVPIAWPNEPIPSAPPHTPPLVAKRYLEGEDAFGREKWNSAVAMYRSALDIATKTMGGVPRGTFFERLKWLHDNHRITPDMYDWATHVRVEGNAALHDPEEFSGDDAKALRLFTDMFLRYVYELPGAVKEFRGETEEAKA